MKKLSCLILFLMILFLFSAALAVEYPVYGACTGVKVNVRESPDEMYPSRGQLIRRAPVVVLGEEGNTYLCSTWVGEGYVPKQYIELFEDMTASEYETYCSEHPNVYRTIVPESPEENGWLLELYYSGKISESELKARWYREPGTGYTGLTRDPKTGRLKVFRKNWW